MNYEFNDIKKRLNRYSFNTKIFLCKRLFIYSLKFRKSVLEGRKPTPNSFPWIHDTFFALAMITPDNNKYRRLITEKQMERELNYMLKVIDKDRPNDESGDIFNSLHSIMLQQMNYQIDYRILAYRYNWIFNFDSYNKDALFKFCSCDYTELILLVFCFEIICVSVLKGAYYNSFINKLFKNKIIIDHFSISRESLCEFYKDIETIKDMAYAYKISWNKPFLKYENKFYLANYLAPMYAFTDGLFFSMCKFNSSFRDRQGKVIEKYIYYLCAKSETFDLVENPNKKYKITKAYQIEYPDVMAKKGNKIFLFESKLCLQNMAFYRNQADSVAKEKEKAIQSVRQCLKHIINIEKNYFKPFNISSKDVDNVYFIISTLSMRVLSLIDIIDEALDYENYEHYRDFVLKHFLLTDLYKLERFLIYKENIDVLFNNSAIRNNANSCIEDYSNFSDTYLHKAFDKLESITNEITMEKNI